MTKAYSTLQIKSVTDTDDERLITGIATTPSTDRDDDILEPLGAKFTLPIPLLSHHNHSQPIGEVIQAEVTAGGILITAKIAKIDEKGKLKDRIDEAWGLHIKEWEWYELSVVTIPANPDAMITGIKQIKAAFNDQPKPINQAQVTKTHQPKPSANNGAVTLTSTQGVTLLWTFKSN